MKKIEAIIRPFKLDDIKEALAALGVQGMTASEVKGVGHQKGRAKAYRGADDTIDFVPKIKIEVVLADGMVTPAIEAIVQEARTDQIGDGNVLAPSKTRFGFEPGNAGSTLFRKPRGPELPANWLHRMAGRSVFRISPFPCPGDRRRRLATVR
jgi:nitrogen regulatory protein P-II 1